MHILYIHQHFAIPKGSTGTRSYEFARRWVKAGHKVTLISGHYDIGGLQAGKGFMRRQAIEGISVVVVGTKYSNKQSFIRRIISFLCFILFSIYAGLRVKDANIIYATSTPLTVGIPALVLKWLKHIPFVFEVRDQWPEIPIEMGIIKNKILIKILLCLERTIYQQSAAIVALSPGMADGIQSVLKKEKNVAIVPNSCDTNEFRPDIGGSKLRKERGWNDKLVLLHFGAMGKANGLEFVIDIAERLKDKPEIHFVLLGKGSKKNSLVEKIVRCSLKNIDILGSKSKEELPKYIAACDVAMVIFANYPILEHNSANKFFDSLSAGKPILLNYSGWQRQVLEQSNAGFGCDLCNLDQFIEKVLYFNANRKVLVEMGQNARRIAVEVYNRDKLASEALTVINSVVDR